MTPKPQFANADHKGTGKLRNKVALISGGDSGIGRAVAVLFAREGASVAILYLDEHEDAKETKRLVEAEGAECIILAGDVGEEGFCKRAVDETVNQWGGLNLLVNNAAEQHPQDSILDISADQMERTFRTNIFSFFHLTKAALPHLREGDAIVNTTSITAYHGSGGLIDYASTKGAILAFTRSLAENLVDKGIRVNAVAPGPIWTPLIPATFDEKHVADFGSDTPMKRAGQPEEVASCFLFLACDDSSYLTGQCLHPNGGTPVNG